VINGINAYKCPNCGRVLLKYYDKATANGGLFVKCRRCEKIVEIQIKNT
jgi:phage FluMu protein Com